MSGLPGMVRHVRPRPGSRACARGRNPDRRARSAPGALMLLDITDALIAAKAPQATRKQAIDIQAAILAAAEATAAESFRRPEPSSPSGFLIVRPELTCGPSPQSASF